MPAPNEFWLVLHQLIVAYRNEGQTTHERVEAISEEFRAMPRVARREVLADLAHAAAILPDIYAAVAPIAMQCEEEEKHAASLNGVPHS